MLSDKSVLPDMTGVSPTAGISIVRFDPVKEMDILQCVVRRDALVALLAAESRDFKRSGNWRLSTVLQALLEVREASLDVVEAVTRWRVTLIKPEVFTVRGANYVAGMATDMAFLATDFTALKSQFLVDLGTGNPFALPCVYHSKATNGTFSRKVLRPRGPPGGTVRTRLEIADIRGTTTPKICSLQTHSSPPADPGENNGTGMNWVGAIDSPGARMNRIIRKEIDEDQGRLKELAKEEDLLLRLGRVDDNQSARLTRAQIFLEAEFARSGVKERMASWWGFHRWTERPWVYQPTPRGDSGATSTGDGVRQAKKVAPKGAQAPSRFRERLVSPDGSGRAMAAVDTLETKDSQT